MITRTMLLAGAATKVLGTLGTLGALAAVPAHAQSNTTQLDTTRVDGVHRADDILITAAPTRR